MTKVSNVTVWVDEDALVELATVPMAFRIGACTFFLTENEVGYNKLEELITLLQSMAETEIKLKAVQS